MAQYHHEQASGKYPPQPPSSMEGYSQGAYVVPPPPMGYPTNDGYNTQHGPAETKSRGDGFLKGW
ncbi:hypothetical protein CFOL_v3_07626 [Cephalotus follicularis]|uniref:CYSTM domain-containing protein n=1 Tax=Cephalotus follicularis TaxID=3775 RepID=A0A1Q3B7Y0_CEPFO|nr:hypothetical protein CFOL_v3_07626 [Cephalotus follicularis]